MAGGESKVARLHETPARNQRSASPQKAFEGDHNYERVATWLREVENFFGKDNNSWQDLKKRKKDKHVHKKFEPKPNNTQKRRKSKAWEAHKPPKDKDACFGCGKKGYMKKDCPKAINASTRSERLKPLLGGGFVAKVSLRIGCGNPCSRLMFFQGQINDQHVFYVG